MTVLFFFFLTGLCACPERFFFFTGGTDSLTTDKGLSPYQLKARCCYLSASHNSLDLLNYFFLLKIDTDMCKTTKHQDVTD